MGLISESAPLMTEAYQRVQEFRFKFYFKIESVCWIGYVASVIDIAQSKIFLLFFHCYLSVDEFFATHLLSMHKLTNIRSLFHQEGT